LAFDEDVRITTYSQFSYFDGQEEWIWKPEPGATQIAARTVSLLGATIQSFEGQENGTLSLVFEHHSACGAERYEPQERRRSADHAARGIVYTAKTPKMKDAKPL
jgi:hypothetical protein